MKVKTLLVPDEEPHVLVEMGNARFTLTKVDATLLVQIMRQALDKPGEAIPAHMASASRFSAIAQVKKGLHQLHFLLQSDSHVTVIVEDFTKLSNAIEQTQAASTKH